MLISLNILYNLIMNFKKILSKIKNYQTIDEGVVSNLYSMSEKSLLAATILSTLVMVSLYSILGYEIIVWILALLFFFSIRLYIAKSYKNNPDKYTLQQWYRIFIILTLLTSFIFSLLSIYFIYHVDILYQMFITTILIGLVAGSMNSLSADIRLSITYSMIIAIPLMISMFTFSTYLHIVMGILLMALLISQITLLFDTFDKNLKLRKQELKIELLKNQQLLLNSLFEKSPVGVLSFNSNLEITECNKACELLFQTKKEDLIGLNFHTLPDTRPLDVLVKTMDNSLQTYTGPYKSIKNLDLWIEGTSFPFIDNAGKVTGGIGIIEDKTKEHDAIKELKFMADHDSLTTLLNRRGFINYMNKLIQKEEHQTLYSLLFYVDLNKFKHINDSMGHAVGDILLIDISNRLKNTLNSDNIIISRLGGDEFIIVVPFISKDTEMIKSKSKKYIKQIKNVFKHPFVINDLHLSMQTSIGIVTINPGSSNIEELVRYADIAMYKAKKSSLNKVSYYNKKLDDERRKLFMLQHELANTLEKSQLTIHLQPLLVMKSNKLIGAEALVRWNHPIEGQLSPDIFIPIAIETGLIADITWWVIEEVCKQINQWKMDDIWNLQYISININAKQLLISHFVDTFLSKLDKYGLSTSDIIIEITERSLINNFEETQQSIAKLRKAGVKCAIDDFGIGYSSLSYLKKLSFDILKIDKEFVLEVQNNPKDIMLMKTILEIGRLFNYTIVIEGIENEEQKNLLLDLDNELIYQGFYFSKAIPIDEFSSKFL